MNDFIPLLVALAGGAALGTFITSIARRKVTRAETDSIVVETATKVVEMQQDTVERVDKERQVLETKLEKAFEKIDALTEQVIELRISQAAERAECAAKLEILAGEISTLKYHQTHPAEFPMEHIAGAGD